jgi:DNA-binding transcriptional LysR family regulator
MRGNWRRPVASCGCASRGSLPSIAIVRAAAAGFGLGFVLEDQVAQQLAGGRVIRELEDSCPRFAGYHLYYPSRREPSAAFALLVEARRYRASRGAAQQWPPTLQSNAL